jgi:aspartate/tyrosine/aromatic aminotransferase
MWEEEITEMRGRLILLRKDLAERLIAKGGTRDFHHLLKGHGMFCFTGLTEAEVDRLISECGIYMVRDGRINLCGLNATNIGYVIDSIYEKIIL